MPRYKLVPNSISGFIGCGITGFILSVLLLSGKSCTRGQVGYQEIQFSNKDSVVKTLFEDRISRLSERKTMLTGNDSGKLEAEQWKYRKAIRGVELERLSFIHSNPDTILSYYSNLFMAPPEKLDQVLRDPGWDSIEGYRATVPVTYIDTDTLVNEVAQARTYTVEVTRSRFDSLMDYFSRNPVAAFWLIFSVAQFTLWFMVIPLLLGMIRSLGERVSLLPAGLISLRNWGLSCILPVLFIGVFSFIFYQFLIDSYIIKDHFFLAHFNGKMKWYAVVGYLAAAGCFGMYLLMSMALDQLNKQARMSGIRLNSDQALKDDYTALKATFDNSFHVTAIILSVFVLWVGLCFTAINQTEAMSFYKLYARKDYLPYDFVLLIGALHSLLLLLFYVPVRIRFNSMQLADEAKTMGESATSRLLGNFYNAVLALLVTASPLLTSLLQKLLTGLI